MPIKIPSNVESNTKKLISTSLLYNKQKNISNKRGKGTKFYKKKLIRRKILTIYINHLTFIKVVVGNILPTCSYKICLFNVVTIYNTK